MTGEGAVNAIIQKTFAEIVYLPFILPLWDYSKSIQTTKSLRVSGGRTIKYWPGCTTHILK